MTAYTLATRRLQAWLRVVVLLTEQRQALELRIARADFFDTALEADCKTHIEICLALADWLDARRSAA